MPLPSSTIQANNFNPIVAGQQAQNQQSEFLVNNLSNLGQSISDSISINNMRKEAQQAAPAIQDAYNQGFQAIQGGQIGQGLAHIASVNAQYAGNPILAKIGSEAQQSGALLAHGVVQSQLVGQRGDNQINNTNAQGQWRMDKQNLANQGAMDVAKERDMTHLTGIGMQQTGDNTRQQALFTQQKALQTQNLQAHAARLQSVLEDKNALQDQKDAAAIQLYTLKQAQQHGFTDPQVMIQKAMAAQTAYNTGHAALDKKADKAAEENDPAAFGMASAAKIRLTDSILQGAEKGIQMDGSPLASPEQIKQIDATRKVAQTALEDPNMPIENKKKYLSAYEKVTTPILDLAAQGLKKLEEQLPELTKSMRSTYRQAQAKAEAAASKAGQSQGADIPDGKIIVNPNTGARMVFTNGEWQPIQ